LPIEKSASKKIALPDERQFPLFEDRQLAVKFGPPAGGFLSMKKSK
jgi:hypothetical protein